MRRSTFEASIKERVELYIEYIAKEIVENEKLLKRYKNSGNRQEAVLTYFIQRLDGIKKEFDIFIKVLEKL